MPFSNIELPSIALTQLKSVVKEKLENQVNVEILYLNHDFAKYLGQEYYWLIANSIKSTNSGLGDWLFRKVAFPEASDNAEAFFSRFLWQFEQQDQISTLLNEKRQDLDIFLDQLIDKYSLDTSFLVGLTSMFTQNMASLAMAKRIKNRNPDIVTVMGGSNCETCMGAVIAKNADAIDFVFSGPALKTFPQFIQHLIDGEKDKCHTIPGVISKNKLALQAVENFNEIGEELDLEKIINLDYDDFLSSVDEKCPFVKDKVGLLFQTSRGCWWGERSQCRFCGLNGSKLKYRAMTPENALKQIDKLFSYAPKVLHFKSVDNIVPKNYFTEVFPKLKTPENASIFYEVKANLKEEQLEVLAQAGVSSIQPGIESLSTSTLKLMRKGITAFQNIDFLKNCQKNNIQAHWNLLVGFPGEEEDVFEKYNSDLPNLFHLPPPSGVFPIRFDRFSPYFREAEKFNLKLKPYDFYEFVYPFEEQDLEHLAYFFNDHNYAAPHMKLTAKWIKKLETQVENWRDRWNLKDGGPPPRLTLEWRENSEIIYDSRLKKEEEHNITNTGIQILEILAVPKKLADLGNTLKNIQKNELETEIAWLLSKGLIFEENNRFMSLVIETGEDSGYI